MGEALFVRNCPPAIMASSCSYVIRSSSWKLSLLVLALAQCSAAMADNSGTILMHTVEFSHSDHGIKSFKSTRNIPSSSSGGIHSNRAQEDGEGLRAELIHRDASSAPGSDLSAKLSRKERLRAAVARSKQRAKALDPSRSSANFISRTSTHKSADISDQKDVLSTPVASANGAYVMKLEMGTPAQSFQMIVDTGSDLVWVQCKPCVSCYTQQGPIMAPYSSSSYATLPCTSLKCQQLSTSSCATSTCKYTYQYGDQSNTRGEFSTETITLATTGGGSKQIPNVAFGCGHTNVGSYGGAGGIVGLGQGPISLTSQLGNLIQNKFSYCLVSFDDAPSKTSPLLFGSAASLTEAMVKSTPILKQGSTYYYVGLQGVSVGGQRLSISTQSGTILDSGTTLTLLEDSAYRQVSRAVRRAMANLALVDGSSVGLDLCFDITGLTALRVPAFSLHFINSDLNPPAENYFVLADSSTMCLAMASSGSLSLSIIGNIMQQNYHILYDRGTSTISFAPAQCDKL